VANALALLEAFDLEHPELGVTELAAKLGLALSTVHRLLTTLVHCRFIEPTGRRTYRLGIKAMEVGSLVLQHRGFGGAIQPFIEELARETGETVNVAILDGQEIVYVAVLESQAVLRPYFALGQRGSAANTALGKAVLAYQTGPEEWPEQLAAELARVKEEGVAFDLEGSEPGVCCVGVPIFSAMRKPVAAISIAGPTGRVDQELVQRAIPLLREAAIKIAASLAPDLLAASGRPGFRASRAPTAR
jgi:IclR family acetate operon transcriptional repressor